MIFGAHVILFSPDAEADRAFLSDLLGLESVDAGHGWLLFALPPAEAAVHPAPAPGASLYLMCEDVVAEVAALARRGVDCAAIEEAPWGSVTEIRLPSGATVGLYQPRHPTAIAPSTPSAAQG